MTQYDDLPGARIDLLAANPTTRVLVAGLVVDESDVEAGTSREALIRRINAVALWLNSDAPERRDPSTRGYARELRLLLAYIPDQAEAELLEEIGRHLARTAGISFVLGVVPA